MICVLIFADNIASGFLTECYDELGTRYQVPVYCLSYPINIVKEGSGRDSPSEISGILMYNVDFGRVLFHSNLHICSYKIESFVLLTGSY